MSLLQAQATWSRVPTIMRLISFTASRDEFASGVTAPLSVTEAQARGHHDQLVASGPGFRSTHTDCMALPVVLDFESISFSRIWAMYELRLISVVPDTYLVQ